MIVPTRGRADARAYAALTATDPVLAKVAALRGRPDPFSWPGGADTGLDNFGALVLHVISQQLSTRVATLLFGRILDASADPVTPGGIVDLGATRLHALGLSRTKAVAIVTIAELHFNGQLSSDQLDSLDDEGVVAALTAVRGIGLWTAEMYLIHQLRRPDVLPASDLGIRKAVQAGWGLPLLPESREVQDRGVARSPFRSYAAALLWASLGPVESFDR